MSLLNWLGIQQAYADTAISAPASTAAHHASAAGGFMSMLPMLVIFVVVFYFLLVRPQSKRAKEQKQMMSELKVADEIATAGGIVGRVDAIHDNFVVITTHGDTEITLQKSSVAQVLPKGTMESIN